MKKILLFQFAFFSILLTADAQSFIKSYNSISGYVVDYASEITATEDGGNISVGLTYTKGRGLDMIFVKTNAKGNVQWSKIWGTEEDDSPAGIIQIKDGGYIISGSSHNGSRFGIFLMKLNAKGIMQWAKHYTANGKTGGGRLVQTPDGGYAFFGSKINYFSRRACLLKTDSTGNLLWSKYIFNTGFIVAVKDMAVTKDGGFILVAGNNPTDDTVSTTGAHLIKLNASGDLEWAKATYGTFNFVKAAKDGGYILGGNISLNENGYQYIDMFITKTNQYGNVSWFTKIRSNTPRVPTGNTNLFYDAIEIPSGYIAVGYTDSTNYNKPVMARFTTSGKLLNSVVLNTPDSAGITRITKYSNNSFCIIMSDNFATVEWYIEKLTKFGDICGPVTNFGIAKDTTVVFKNGIVPVTPFNNIAVTSSYLTTSSKLVTVKDICVGSDLLTDGKAEQQIASKINDADIFLSPNPVKNTLYLKWTGTQQTSALIEIYSVYGKKMYEKTIGSTKGNNNTAIAVNNFAKGIYLLKLKTGTTTKTVKFIKE